MKRTKLLAFVFCLMVLFSGLATKAIYGFSRGNKPPKKQQVEFLDYQIEVQKVLSQDSNDPNTKNWNWLHFNTASIPGAGDNGSTAAVMTVMKLLRSSDYYKGPFVARSNDGGKTWAKPQQRPGHGWRINKDGDTVAIADMELDLHEPTGKVLGLGAQVLYTKTGGFVRNKLGCGKIAYTVYDPKTDEWTPLKTVDIPETATYYLRFYAIASCAQWHVKKDGTLLIPVYHCHWALQIRSLWAPSK